MRNKILEVENLSKVYSLPSGHRLEAVKDVSVSFFSHEIVGIIGESGCGKSTLANMIAGILSPSSGSIYYKGSDISKGRRTREMCQSIQLIFQDSAGALNPRMTVFKLIKEAISLRSGRVKDIATEVARLLQAVGLDIRYAKYYPGELSGGQRQRIAIARALAMEPDVLIADEPIASLDVSVQAQVINLLMDLQKERGFTMLFIAHDLSVVRHISDRVVVMYNGKVVETGATERLFSHPTHAYTKVLLGSILKAQP